jgi:phosphate transport system permease protein
MRQSNDASRASTTITQTLAEVRQHMAQGDGYRQRRLHDRLTRYGITTGGIGVVFAVLLIFFYLLSVVLPIFKPASVEPETDVAVEMPSPVVHFSTEEYGELVLAIGQTGLATYHRVADGSLAGSGQLVPEGESLGGIVKVAGRPTWLAAFTRNGQLSLWQQSYQLTYPDGKRHLTPVLDAVLGDEPLQLDVAEPRQVAVHADDDALKVVVVDPQGWHFRLYDLETDFLSEELSATFSAQWTLPGLGNVAGVHLANDGRWVYLVLDSGQVMLYRWQDDAPEWIATESLPGQRKPTVTATLLGDYSLLIGDSKGFISQWFGYSDKDTNQLKLAKVREFRLADAPIRQILPESLRKGFVATDAHQTLGLFYTTSERTLYKGALPQDSRALAINGRSNRLIALTSSGLATYCVENEHPEISWKSLWQKVWYESFPEPTYVWQSSASNNDFEAKFSLAPLAYGTLKAAFYAMLFAVPLALAGAIYTAYFMSPGLRQVVKPTIEIMEALPTVILGFLAGLWLAPFVEQHLPGVMLFLTGLPLSVMAVAWGFARLPSHWQRVVPDGWRPLALIPVVVILAWFCIGTSSHLENILFDGNARTWLRDSLGVTFDQRNALVVGLAMGFAVIPTIFSIAEDAVFSVPKHLVSGSLALGANPWQTMVRVVLPTASPGIFSALMIGMGRAVGETMIVLMATGNTPIMNMNIFEGMRTLAANIAVEMPESEVGSSHYRVLFLAALVLFAFTFVANTVAELVRQRLRNKYSSL